MEPGRLRADRLLTWLSGKHFQGGCILAECSLPAVGCSEAPLPHYSPPLFKPASLQLLNSLLGGLALNYAADALSWIIILYEMFALYPPLVLKCQECIPRPSILNVSAWAWQFSDMNIMALNASLHHSSWQVLDSPLFSRVRDLFICSVDSPSCCICCNETRDHQQFPTALENNSQVLFNLQNQALAWQS